MPCMALSILFMKRYPLLSIIGTLNVFDPGFSTQAEEGIFCDMFLPAAVSFAGQISFILSFYRIR